MYLCKNQCYDVRFTAIWSMIRILTIVIAYIYGAHAYVQFFNDFGKVRDTAIKCTKSIDAFIELGLLSNVKAHI